VALVSTNQFDTTYRTAVDVDRTLDKEFAGYSEIFNAFKVASKFYSFKGTTER
jgi:hypothetical protein